MNCKTIARLLTLLFLVPLFVTAQDVQLKPVGSLKVTTTEDGTVYLDGIRIGVTLQNNPLVQNAVTEGKHIVEYRSDISTFQIIEIKPGQELVVNARQGRAPDFNNAEDRLYESFNYKDPWAKLKPEEVASMQAIQRLLDNLEFAEAEAAIKTQMEVIKKSPIPTYYLGQLALARAEDAQNEAEMAVYLRQAEAAFKEGTSGRDLFAYSLAGLTEVYALQRNFDGMHENGSLGAAIADQAGDGELLARIAEAYLASKSYFGIEQATTLLAKAEGHEPNNAKILLAAGDVWFVQGIKDIPLQKYQQAIAADPNLVRAHYQLGRYHIQQRQYEQGASAFVKAINLDKNFAPAYRELGELYSLAGQYEEARNYFYTYLQMRPKDLNARYRYTIFLYLAGNHKFVVEEAEKVLADTTSRVMQRLAIYSHYELGNYDKSRAYLQQYSQAVPAEQFVPRDYEYRGKLAMQAGKLAEGEQDLLRAIELDPSRTDLYQDLVKAYYAAGNTTRAVELLELTVETEPTLQNYIALARGIEGLKDFERADSVYQVCMEKFPSSAFPTLYCARNAATNMDRETTNGAAVDYYKQLIGQCQANEEQLGKYLPEAYKYLAFYYYNAEPEEDKDLAASLEYSNKYLELMPNDENVTGLRDYLQALKDNGEF